MALTDYYGEPVLHGEWMYGGVKLQRVIVVAHDHDWNYQFLKDSDGVHEDDQPLPVGPDGRLYTVFGTSCPPQPTLEAAKTWADDQPWGPAAWKEEG